MSICRALPKYPLRTVGFTESEGSMLSYSARICTVGNYTGGCPLDSLTRDMFEVIAGLEGLDDLAPGGVQSLSKVVNALASGRETPASVAKRYAFDTFHDYDGTWDSISSHMALVMVMLLKKHGSLSTIGGLPLLRHERQEQYLHISSSNLYNRAILLPDGRRVVLVSEQGKSDWNYPNPRELSFRGKPVEFYREDTYDSNLGFFDRNGEMVDNIPLQGKIQVEIGFEGHMKLVQDKMRDSEAAVQRERRALQRRVLQQGDQN